VGILVGAAGDRFTFPKCLPLIWCHTRQTSKTRSVSVNFLFFVELAEISAKISGQKKNGLARRKESRPITAAAFQD
jgi:hypothetical protein